MNIDADKLQDIQDFDNGATVKDLMIALMRIKDKNLPVVIETNYERNDVKVEYLAETSNSVIIGGF